jgi:hypothetical protein
MAEITAAIDEGGANTLFTTALGLVPLPPQSGSGSLGPFVASYSAAAQFVSGSIDLIAPATVRVANLRLNWQVSLSFGIDLNRFLPRLCLPQVCVDIPCVGRVCTPRICIPWPSITVPVSLADFVETTVDFGLDVALAGANWRVRALVQNVSQLQFGPATAGMLLLIGLAITPLLLAIPFIGPFLAIAVNAILAAIGIAGLFGFLGPIISPFVSGLAIPIYQQPQAFQVLPASGPNDPAVFITLDAVTADIQSTDEDELVLGVDISA